MLSLDIKLIDRWKPFVPLIDRGLSVVSPFCLVCHVPLAMNWGSLVSGLKDSC